MEMDVHGPIQAPDFGTFDLYCDRVASAVGRLSVKVFGMAGPHGRQLAHHLGRALQFTNVLRDLDEDAAMDRLYLPREALADAGVTATEPLTVIADPRIDRACRWVAKRAHEHYRKADTLMKAGAQGRLRAPRLMSAVYGGILKEMEACRLGASAPPGEPLQEPPRLDAGPARTVLVGRVYVVGAGLSGLSCAVKLASRGVAVTVLEATGQAGGRCRSYHDPQLDMVLDNGNHFILSGNHAAFEYLALIGSARPHGGSGRRLAGLRRFPLRRTLAHPAERRPARLVARLAGTAGAGDHAWPTT